tara:strand:+ start:45 stop:758 length:714 start_codon:yes stop_codon:yes gene_type:complete
MFEIFKNKKIQKDANIDKNFEHRILKSNIFKEKDNDEEEIYFGCGCFWGAEKCFWKLPGVVTTSVGYAGGTTNNPNYNEVCSGYTGHAEVVKVIWDINKIDISDLLKMFWECHDPTQKNRQGNDFGTQYRSAIFFSNKNQFEAIKNSKKAYQKELSKNNLGTIETEIEIIKKYYFAEDYHQQYLAVKGSRQYCSASPTNIKLDSFDGCNFKLESKIWENFNWEIDKCVLRSTNEPIN